MMSGPHDVQTAPGVFKEATFKALDYALHTAAKNDVRLLLPFINYWEEYGGREVRQKMVLERWTTPNLSRRTCTCEYELQSSREIGGRRETAAS
jgi:hypothetical protein